MDLRLRGKVALITGASRGIGRAIAERFAEEGADVAICARDAGAVRETATALSAHGVRVHAAALDVADAESLGVFVNDAATALGGLDAVVSNVSLMTQGDAPETWRRLFEVDVLGTVETWAAVRPHLEAAAGRGGDAAFLLIGTTAAAETDAPNPYGALKAALAHYAKGIARGCAALGIRCNVVSPGPVLFPGGVWDAAREQHPGQFDATLARIPMGRMAAVEDVADAAVFLASPRSAFITGVNLVVDGGLLRRVAP